MNNRPRLHFTSSPFARKDGDKLFEECMKVAAAHDFEFGIQLHNSASEKEIAICAGFGVPLSAHAPLLAEFNINLGKSDISVEMAELAHTAALMRRYGITEAVFHGFRMCDLPTPAFNRNKPYELAMSVGFRPDLAARPDSKLNRNFIGEPEFIERTEILKNNLTLLRQNYPDLTFCIENDFPSHGSANLLASGAIQLQHPLCLDAGHLWITCYLLGNDFLQETAAFANSGRLKMVHLHASPFTNATPFENWRDGHLPLQTDNAMNLPDFVRICRDAGVELFVLEIPSGTADDIHDFAVMWEN